MLVQSEGAAFAQCTLGIDVQQLGRGVAYCFRRLLLGFLPGIAAEAVNRCLLGRAAGVAADQVQLRHRHIELVGIGVFEQQEFVGAFAEVEIHQAPVPPDAVLHMHHRVAWPKLREIAQHPLDRGLALFALRLCARGGGVELGFGDDRDRLALENEARIQR